MTAVSGGNDYTWSEKGIAWPGEAKKYASKPGYDASQITPPPNWAKRFPDGYNDSNLPNLKEDEHFQNWMRTAGLPTFTKLWGRNDDETLKQGSYQIVINMSASLLSILQWRLAVCTLALALVRSAGCAPAAFADADRRAPSLFSSPLQTSPCGRTRAPSRS